MGNNKNGSLQTLRNLASALRDQHAQLSGEPKLPAPTDQDILRAMLGKPWKTNGGEESQRAPVRKAG
jgi:hypothetical protein